MKKKEFSTRYWNGSICLRLKVISRKLCRLSSKVRALQQQEPQFATPNNSRTASSALKATVQWSRAVSQVKNSSSSFISVRRAESQVTTCRIPLDRLLAPSSIHKGQASSKTTSLTQIWEPSWTRCPSPVQRNRSIDHHTQVLAKALRISIHSLRTQELWVSLVNQVKSLDT